LGSNFNWTTNADWQALHQGSCFTVFDGNLFCGTPLYIIVDFTDVCGGLSTIYRSFYVDCPAYSFVSVYPNPNNGIFTLKRMQPADAAATPLNQSATPAQKKSQEQLTVRIYASSTAALVKEMQIVLSDETTINTGGLPKGKYIVQVVRGNTVIHSSQMMIEGDF
jgi:hypothetical protein